MNVVRRLFEAFNGLSWIKTLRAMFMESWTNAKTNYFALVGRNQDSQTLESGIAALEKKTDELRAKLTKLQRDEPQTQRDQWLAIPVKSRIVYAHNRWLAKPKILVFTPNAESIGLIFQLLHDSLRLARFLKRYEARHCRAEDYESSDFNNQIKRFAGLKTERNAYGKETPVLIEWSLRRGPIGPILIWNYSRDDVSYNRRYVDNVEELSSRALFGDMPDDDETQRILMDATRRVVGDAVFNDAVANGSDAVLHARETMKRYSNRPGDDADALLPQALVRSMKEVDPNHWLLALPFDPGEPYWEELPKPQPSPAVRSLEREIKARVEMKTRMEARLRRLADGPSYLDLVVDGWFAFWFGLAIALLNVVFGGVALVALFGALYLLVNVMIAFGRMLKEVLKEIGGCCCGTILVLIVLFILGSANSENGK